MTIVTNHPTCCNLLFRKNYNLQHSFKFFRFSFITILRNIVNYTRTIKFLAILQPEQNAKMLSLLAPSIKSRSKILSNQESWFLLFKLATKIIGLLNLSVHCAGPPEPGQQPTSQPTPSTLKFGRTTIKTFSFKMPWINTSPHIFSELPTALTAAFRSDL